MDSSVSPKDEIWFLGVCRHISKAVYNPVLRVSYFDSQFHTSSPASRLNCDSEGKKSACTLRRGSRATAPNDENGKKKFPRERKLTENRKTGTGGLSPGISLKIAHVLSIFNASVFHILIGSIETSVRSSVFFQHTKKMVSVRSSQRSRKTQKE